MQVKDLMTHDVRTCSATDSLSRAAQIMWETDCGCVPVVDDRASVVGMVTDRDICMAAYTQGRTLADMTVASAASSNVVTVRENDTLHRAETLMRDAQVRRLAVVDAEGQLVGLLSIGDLARRAADRNDGIGQLVVDAMVGVCRPRADARVEKEKGSSKDRAAPNLQTELRKGLALLHTLRDEVRLRLHLGGLDLKDQWEKLEPHLGEVERKAEDLTEASRTAVVDALKKLERIRSALGGHH